MSKTVNGTNQTYAWDPAGSLPLLLTDGTNEYIYAPGGVPLEQITGSTVLFLQHDQQGSTRLITNQAGNQVASYTYTPYGKLAATTGTATTPLLYDGQYQDRESKGLYYMRARYYDPETAQFITLDPAKSITQFSYVYAGSNPINASDPAGSCSWNPFSSDSCELAAPARAASAVGSAVVGGAKAAWNATGGSIVNDLQNHPCIRLGGGNWGNVGSSLFGGGACETELSSGQGVEAELGLGAAVLGGAGTGWLYSQIADAAASIGPLEQIELAIHAPFVLGVPLTVSGGGLLFQLLCPIRPRKPVPAAVVLYAAA